ncbi:MAG: N-acetylglucosamine-6-phosphate deacetylase [Gammaproteobacteria bacterium RIFCSPHIGHO2_12_FULL_45_9]|nr:MAG: N-acetylglucosamine-6-phosphate deacetylase [Gammaproteobacteria bacterium RIFCSPHIGHO2_12_FULL_45_9]
MTTTRLIFHGLSILAERNIQQHYAVVIENARIHAVIPEADIQHFLPAQLIEYPSNYFLAPGFIDLHIHGAKGCDVMDASVEALTQINHALIAEGVTAYLATTMTGEKSAIEAALINVNQCMRKQPAGATILGVHLEGPFIAPSKAGAQRREPIVLPDLKLIQHWQALAPDTIKIVTLAPEQEGALDCVRYLKQHNIIPAIGHTDADYAETMAAIKLGCCHGTHLFNAMRGLHHREPGALGALLLSDQVTAELIVDGVHLHPAIVQLAWRIKGQQRLLLVTDAMRAKCFGGDDSSGEGHYDLGGQSVHVMAGVVKLPDNTLAGSILTMPQAIRNLMTFTQCTLLEAVKLATENPAKVLGLFHQRGSIAPGKIADLVVLSDQLEVVTTVCSGKKVYDVQHELHF